MRATELIERAKKYIDDAAKGKLAMGELTRLTFIRHINDLEDKCSGYYFDELEAKRALAVSLMLRQAKGEWAGKPFILEPWQCAIVYMLFGWRLDDGTRRFREAIIEVARKNGKTTFGAYICNLMLMFDGEYGAEVYSAAVDHDQAKISWRTARDMINKSPGFAKEVKIFVNSITYEASNSFFQPLSKDSGNKDGLNPSFALYDERHAWPNNDISDVIRSGMGARRHPLTMSITTAGFDRSKPYYKDRSVAIDVLRGIKKKDDLFVLIYCPDKDDDWKSEETWMKANPNMGVSVSKEYLQRELENAIIKGGRDEVNFRTKNVNQWMDAPEVWVADDVIQRNNKSESYDDCQGEECYCGLDISSHVDITALSIFFPRLNKVKWLFWIPETKLQEADETVDYRLWHDQGYINVTEGEIIDWSRVSAEIAEELRKYKVKCLAFDPYKAYDNIIVSLSEKYGMQDVLKEYPQNISYMSEPCKQIEGKLIANEFDFCYNPVIRWMFANVVMYYDINNNMRPSKKKSRNKIDGVSAMVNAYGAYLADRNSSKVYVNHDLRIIEL